MTQALTQSDLVLSLKASMAIQARNDVLQTLVTFAERYITQGLTQEGADVLAFVMRCDALPDYIEDTAIELWEDLERWICPRVLLDAEIFGKKAYLEDVVEYVLAGEVS